MRQLTISVFLLLSMALLVCGCGETTAVTTTNAAATATVPHTATKVATGPAVLGGTQADFTARYGAPNDRSDGSSLHFGRYPGSNVDALIVNFVTVGTGAGRADSVVGQASDQPPDQGWSMATAHSTCASYRPPDSKAGKTVQVVDTSGTAVGEDDIYTSATLATEFDASVFTDADSNPVTAGTFDVFFLFKTDSPGNIDSCSLFLGSTQTTP